MVGNKPRLYTTTQIGRNLKMNGESGKKAEDEGGNVRERGEILHTRRSLEDHLEIQGSRYSVDSDVMNTKSGCHKWGNKKASRQKNSAIYLISASIAWWLSVQRMAPVAILPKKNTSENKMNKLILNKEFKKNHPHDSE